MRKMIYGILMFMLTVFVVGCASNTAENIEVNDDKIPSIYSVIGEKKIVRTNSEVENKVRKTTLTYKAGSISEKEMQEYIDYLRETENYVYTLDTKQSAEGTMLQLGKESVTSGKIVLVDVLYPAMASESVKIMYRSGEGTLKINE